MPIYVFRPVDSRHPDWLASNFASICRSHAQDEESARQQLHERFRVGFVENGEHREPPLTPWLNKEKAECIGVLRGPDPEYQEGLIEIMGLGNRDEIAKAALGTLPVTWSPLEAELPVAKWGESEWDKAVWGGPTEEGGGQVIGDTSPVARHIINHVIRNRTVLQYQAQTLSDYLEGLIGLEAANTDRRNYQTPKEVLGITGGISDENLLTLLQALRDELRRFNDALAKEKVETGDLMILRDTALKAAAETFGKTVGVGAGGLLILSIGGLLDSTGLMTWKDFFELKEQLKGS